jgi:nucleoside-diphosphate-sugar epimerase
MTTLITGAGLVGTSFAQHAARRGQDVVFLDPAPRDDFIRAKLGNADWRLINDDVRSLPGLIAAIEGCKADTVVHTASLIGGRVGAPLHNGFAINIGGAMNIAEAVRLTGVKRLVHLSTFGVYDWRRITKGPVAEDSPRGQGVPYSNSKVAQEMIFEASSKQYGFELMMLRPGNVFGVGHFAAGSGGGRKVQDLVTAGLTREPARIPQAQTMAFVYLYARDMGRAVDLAATRPVPAAGNIFNLGYDVVTGFDELVETIRKQLPRLKVEIEPGTPPVSRDFPLDMTAAKTHLGWTPEYTMDEAFADYIERMKVELGL